ncbi:MAG: hypothetical protein DRH57_06605 [Candidatus Cloacimonadota bacterium]|nr:MAG: hypothetical protein DRH57_06605 [Candidatus Cloacimonadota bacterium]
MSYSWIIKSVGLTYNSIEPIKMLDTEILELDANVMMYNSRKEALLDLVKDMNGITAKGSVAELKELKPLAWEDATLWTFFLSKVAIVSAPIVLYTLIPPWKFTVIKNIRKSKTINPEWWI